ncbi:MAG: HisA/HisF-related TIM barrel protein [Candidatus Bathyarchaeia archaeon]
MPAVSWQATVMRVIPVIDLRDGIAVHARQGRRAEYRPLQSVLCEGCDPTGIAEAFHQLGFKEAYLADLDAIMDGKPNLTLYSRMAQGGKLSLMIDAAVNTAAEAVQVLCSGASKVIVGTETLTSPELISLLVRRFGEKVVVSLDLMSRRLLTKARGLAGMQAVEAALYFQGCGVAELIVLDLARVGSGLGPDFELAGEICDRCEPSILIGGGVRDLADLRRLQAIGADGVLVATALHSGAITLDQLRAAGFLQPSLTSRFH